MKILEDRSQIVHFLFFVAAVVELISVHLDWSRYITKPSLMILLITFYLMRSPSIDRLFVIAMLAAWFGDVFLLFNGEAFFLMGLSSFLVMQLLYAYLFYQQGIDSSQIKIIATTLLIGAALLIGYILVSKLEGAMLVAVLIYSASILAMASAAILRHAHPGYTVMVMGTWLFVISDAILGINMFVGAFDYAGELVMLSYILAQYAIVRSYLAYENAKVPGA